MANIALLHQAIDQRCYFAAIERLWCQQPKHGGAFAQLPGVNSRSWLDESGQPRGAARKPRCQSTAPGFAIGKLAKQLVALRKAGHLAKHRIKPLRSYFGGTPIERDLHPVKLGNRLTPPKPTSHDKGIIGAGQMALGIQGCPKQGGRAWIKRLCR